MLDNVETRCWPRIPWPGPSGMLTSSYKWIPRNRRDTWSNISCCSWLPSFPVTNVYAAKKPYHSLWKIYWRAGEQCIYFCEHEQWLNLSCEQRALRKFCPDWNLSFILQKKTFFLRQVIWLTPPNHGNRRKTRQNIEMVSRFNQSQQFSYSQLHLANAVLMPNYVT